MNEYGEHFVTRNFIRIFPVFSFVCFGSLIFCYLELKMCCNKDSRVDDGKPAGFMKRFLLAKTIGEI